VLHGSYILETLALTLHSARNLSKSLKKMEHQIKKWLQTSVRETSFSRKQKKLQTSNQGQH